ncbi:zinc finger domain containing protein, partial [Entamoeba invadens IP1]
VRGVLHKEVVVKNMRVILPLVIESGYALHKCDDIRNIIELKNDDLETLLEICRKYNDERSVLLIYRKLKQFDECFKCIRERIKGVAPLQEEQILISKEMVQQTIQNNTVKCHEDLQSDDKTSESQQKEEKIIQKFVIGTQEERKPISSTVQDIKGILDDMRDVVSAYLTAEKREILNTNDTVILIMKKIYEVFSTNTEVLERLQKEYREVVEVICEKSPIESSLKFCQEICTGNTLKLVLRDLLVQTQRNIALLKNIHVIANSQMKKSKQCQLSDLKHGVITCNTCVLCKQKREDSFVSFGCGHCYHTTCISSSCVCLICNGLA